MKELFDCVERVCSDQGVNIFEYIFDLYPPFYFMCNVFGC